MNKKDIKKPTKPAFVVDATWCEDADDLHTAFIFAKCGNTPISEDDLMFIVDRTIHRTMDEYKFMENIANMIADVFTTACNWCEKKSPWYKRFWNWLTRKK